MKNEFTGERWPHILGQRSHLSCFLLSRTDRGPAAESSEPNPRLGLVGMQGLRPGLNLDSSPEGPGVRESWTKSVLHHKSLVNWNHLSTKAIGVYHFFYIIHAGACMSFSCSKTSTVLQNAVEARRQGRNSRRCVWEEAGKLTSLVFLEPGPRAEGIFLPRRQGRECASHAHRPGDGSRGVLLGRQPLSPARA